MKIHLNLFFSSNSQRFKTEYNLIILLHIHSQSYDK
jgi:hypothetical protein